jgi:hypothetical protein
MDALVNRWDLSDWQNVRDAFLGQGGYLHRRVVFHKFVGYTISGNSTDPDNMIRIPAFRTRGDHAWLSQVKVFDTVKRGYFTTGDLDVASSFIIRGYTGGYTLPSGAVIPEYAGDQIEWNGKLWIVADQLEPVQAGTNGPIVFYRTTMRRADRSGTEQGAGA